VTRSHAACHPHQGIDLRNDLFVSKWRRQEHVRPQAQSFESSLYVLVLRYQDDGRRRQATRLGTNAARQPKAVDVWKNDVGQHQIRECPQRTIEAFACRWGSIRLVCRIG
jgi:hypothetical protein